jgi:hypothetical protein
MAGIEARVKLSSHLFLDTLFTLDTFLLSAYPTAAQEDAASIVRKSAEANQRDWTAVTEFDNSERDRTKGGDKTYAVTMIEGSPYERLIAMNGHALSAAKSRKSIRNMKRRRRNGNTNQPISDPGGSPSIRRTGIATI